MLKHSQNHSSPENNSNNSLENNAKMLTSNANPEGRWRGNLMTQISGADLKHVLPEALAGKSANCCDDEGWLKWLNKFLLKHICCLNSIKNTGWLILTFSVCLQYRTVTDPGMNKWKECYLSMASSSPYWFRILVWLYCYKFCFTVTLAQRRREEDREGEDRDFWDK